uniref:DUF4197 domain-containing protein n=1 Tax=Candidatus Kentrum eta TaxID=2126337 RepID=A0A450U9X7_9GAMM|nr:MAG: Protein of unknown function (DUF4197) [Candidatus Kentron sp. H]
MSRAKKLFGNSRRSEVVARLWFPQGAMGAKIRIVVDYTTQFSPPSQRGRAQFGGHRGRLRISKQLLRVRRGNGTGCRESAAGKILARSRLMTNHALSVSGAASLVPRTANSFHETTEYFMKTILPVVVSVCGGLLASPVHAVDPNRLMQGAQQGLSSVGTPATEKAEDSDVGPGLKEALNIGAERAIALLGESGGFLNDESVRIGLPGSLHQAAELARAVGQGALVDEFETTVNRAAEKAIPETIDIVRQVVGEMSWSDAQGILNGPDDAATEYLREKGGPALAERIKPIVSEATDASGATSAYKQLAGLGQESPSSSMGGAGLGSAMGSALGSALGGLIGGDSMDLDSYVTDKALDGLFLKLAEEEKAIRTDPVARGTDLLKSVFGG